MSVPCADCCNPSCVIVTDTFDVDLSNFTTTGSPTVGGGLLDIDSGDGVITVSAAGSVDAGTRVEVFPQTASGTATLRLYLAYTDSNNFLFIELAIAASAGTMRTGQKLAGTERWLGPALTLTDTGAALNARSRLRGCWSGGETIAATSGTDGGPPTSGTGTSWTDPTNITVDDTSYAQWAGSFEPTEETNDLFARPFSISIPPGSTIDGIGVTIKHADLGTDAAYVVDAKVMLIDGDGNQVGDNKALGTLIGGSSPQTRSYGGATDDWNANLIWEDLLSGDFGVVITYRNEGEDNATSVIVDYVELAIWYTTPSRTPGTFSAFYRNTTAPNDEQCIHRPNVFTDGGLKAGVAAVTGDWDTTDFNYVYLASESRPTCEECACVVDPPDCACCEASIPAASYSVDLGAGGWTDDQCGHCDQVNGAYVLDFALRASDGTCHWFFEEPVSCSITGGGGTVAITAFRIQLSLVPINNECSFQVRIGFVMEDGSGATNAGAYYAGDPGEPIDCDQEETIIAQLISVSGDVCNGTLPATVTITRL